MSALTTDTTMLAADGVSDPKVGYPGLVAISKKVNFAQKNAAASTNYEFLDIPEGFVMTAAMVKEIEKCPSGTLTLKTKSDSATIGSAVTVGSTNLAKEILAPAADVDITTTKTGDVSVSTAKASWAGTDLMKLVTGVSGSVSAPGGKAYSAGDMLCIVASVAMAVGEVEVVIVGYFPDGEDSRYTPMRSVPWRKIGNTHRNVAEPDRLLGR